MAAAAALVLVLGLAAAWTPDLPRAELEARHARGPQDFVQVDGMRLHVRDTGPREAPAVLLLHGFGSSLHTWDAWAEALQSNHRVLRYDQPGAGLSAPDRLGLYTDERGIAVLAAVLDQAGVQRASIVGHSMGGRLAWRFAAAHPGRVDKLVLVAPDGFASPGFAYGRPPDMGWYAGALRWSLPRSLLRAGLAQAWGDPEALPDAAVTRTHELLRAPGNRQALLDRMGQLVLQPPEPWLARISAPTLLVWGERDRMIPAANAADYQRLMPQARLLGLPGVGHLPQEEAPAAVLPALDAFFDR